MSWASLLKAGGKAAKWAGRGAGRILETGGKAILHPQQTLKASVEDVQDGSVILMHDLFEATADATELVVPALAEMGYKMVTISELAAQYGYTLEPHKEYYDFYPKNSPDERIRELYAEE